MKTYHRMHSDREGRWGSVCESVRDGGTDVSCDWGRLVRKWGMGLQCQREEMNHVTSFILPTVVTATCLILWLLSGSVISETAPPLHTNTHTWWCVCWVHSYSYFSLIWYILFSSVINLFVTCTKHVACQALQKAYTVHHNGKWKKKKNQSSWEIPACRGVLLSLSLICTHLMKMNQR